MNDTAMSLPPTYPILAVDLPAPACSASPQYEHFNVYNTFNGIIVLKPSHILAICTTQMLQVKSS